MKINAITLITIILSAALLLQPLTAAAKKGVKHIAGEDSAALNLPFSDAVRVDNIIFMSGQLGVTTNDFKLVEGGIGPETHQIFSNMKTLLAGQGRELKDIFKCTVMMDDISEWPAFNKIYVTYFPGKKPARSAFGANGLALGAAVEMECWAYAR